MVRLAELKVRLVTQQTLHVHEVMRFTDELCGNGGGRQWLPTDNGFADADLIPELAGRLCYLSYDRPRPGGNAAYLAHIKECSHGNVIEHSVFGLLLTGVSRSLTHELIRHRAGFSYSELSQRYVDASDVAFVPPPDLWEEIKAAREYLAYASPRPRPGGWTPAPPTDDLMPGLAWLRVAENALNKYEILADYLAAKAERQGLAKTEARKFARQAARSVLPNCAESKILVTGNARAWRTFLEQRGSRHADAEIRRLALAVLAVLQVEAPVLFGDYELAALPHGGHEITTPYRKV